jgi:hypothetical protein
MNNFMAPVLPAPRHFNFVGFNLTLLRVDPTAALYGIGPKRAFHGFHILSIKPMEDGQFALKMDKKMDPNEWYKDQRFSGQSDDKGCDYTHTRHDAEVLFKHLSNCIAIKEKFKRSGFTYILTKRGLSSLIFEKQGPRNHCSYEVFRICYEKPHEKTINGEKYTTKLTERYPLKKDLGVWAWAFKGKDRAIEKYRSLENGTSSILN